MEHIIAGQMTTQGAYATPDVVEDGETTSLDGTKEPAGNAVFDANGKSVAERAGIDPKNPSKILKTLNRQTNGQFTSETERDAEQKDAASPDEGEELSEEYLDKKVTVTVEGQKHRMTVREAIKLQQLEKASRSKMNTAVLEKRKLEQAWERLQDPQEYFKARGMDPVAFAESTLQKQLQLMQESPQEKSLREAKEKLDYYERQEKAQAEQQKQAEEIKLQSKFNSEFVEAWKSTGLPHDRKFGQMVAAEMLAANARGEDLQWPEAAGKVKEAFDALVTKTVRSQDPEGILRTLGPEKEKALREYLVNRVSGSQTPGQPAPTHNSGPRPSARRTTSSPNETAASNGTVAPKNLNEREWLEWFKNH